MIREETLREISKHATRCDLSATHDDIILWCYSIACAIEGGAQAWQNPAHGEVPITPGDVADWLATDEMGIRASFFRWLKRKNATQQT